ncbi:MAG: hypothetical protein NVS1B10_01580 [Candidatus Saccharimonadales bacterium]
MAANTDLFKKVLNNYSSTLNAPIANTDTSLTPASVTNVPTDTAVVFVIDRVDASGNLTPSKREYIKGTVVGGSVTNLVRGLGGSTAQAHATGAVIEGVWTQDHWNDAVNGILIDHDQAGRHKGLTDTNGNNILSLSPVASAVNSVQILNSITGTGPTIKPQGTDTNIDLNLSGKGAGVVKLPTPASYTSTGTTSVTAYYMNLGAFKIAWGTSGSISLTGPITGLYTQSLPASFFTTIQSVSLSIISVTGSTSQYITGNGTSTSTVGFAVTCTSTGAATNTVSWYVIGT